jgi:hypothetical protein
VNNISWDPNCKVFTNVLQYPLTSYLLHPYLVGRDSVVGIATHYGLDGPGMNPDWGEIFCTRPDRPWGPPSLLYNGYRISFPGVKWPWRGVDHPPTSSDRVKERVELYLYSPSGPLWPVLGRTLPLPYTHITLSTLMSHTLSLRSSLTVRLSFIKKAMHCVCSKSS